jgi:transcription antitermination factor NusA-like protein
VEDQFYSFTIDRELGYLNDMVDLMEKGDINIKRIEQGLRGLKVDLSQTKTHMLKKLADLSTKPGAGNYNNEIARLKQKFDQF